jgi:lipid II:glycine glycyltransferase (peptidoglycan interpeptide bridge formation enzyme)
VDFYIRNLEISNKSSRFDLAHFVTIFRACEARQCGSALVARLSDGSPVAMTFLVWDDCFLYYLLSTRTPGAREGGAASLLIWSAIQKAHELGLSFDFDGVSTSGIARFYAGFGGQICNRLIVTGKKSAFSAAQYVKAVVSGADRESSKFT